MRYLNENPIFPINREPINNFILNKGILSITKTIKAIKEKRKYFREVKRLTKINNLSCLENFNKRATYIIVKKIGLKKALMSNDYYVLDHKISIAYGYKYKIRPEYIANINNLRYITGHENQIKKDSCIFE